MAIPNTHVSDQVHIDELTRKADGSLPWMLEKRHAEGSHPITPNNELKVLMCGQEAFGDIAHAIENAKSTIDIICWGFDPAMELVRDGGKDWPRGQPYGSMLVDAAANGRNVKVRLLVWYDRWGSAKQNNMPGLTGDQRRGYWISQTITSSEDAQRQGEQPFPGSDFAKKDTPLRSEQKRNDYCVQWWRQVKAAPSPYPGLEFRTRNGSSDSEVRASLADEENKPSGTAETLGGTLSEKQLLENNATHHQKTILIDYDYKGGETAVGYVMGLNSLTDYWDTPEHLFDTKLREPDWKLVSDSAKALGSGKPISGDPYQDYVCRIIGPALQCVHKNFVDAWKRAGGKPRADDADIPPAKLKTRIKSAYRTQIVRTQPQEKIDKTIKETYYHAPLFAYNYLYLENQYFFYESWIRLIKESRRTFMSWAQDAGTQARECQLLHMFIVIPWPEDEGMVPRTYDTVKGLGEASSFPGQKTAMEKGEAANAKARQHYNSSPTNAEHYPHNAPRYDPLAESSAKVEAPVKNHATGELEGLGLKVLMARLVTHNKGAPMPKPELNYRQVYIHSKLMVIDDAFFTVGSANMNQRSMAADSEINVATDDHGEARRVRQMVWGQHTGGTQNGGDGSPKDILNTFEAWKKLMEKNKNNMRVNESIVGFLIPFEDPREVHFRHG